MSADPSGTPSANAPDPEAVRPAATVVIARHGPDPLILMVRRSARSPFMPSTLVFPGGRVDPADGAAGSDASFAQAARREAAEEVGIDLAAHDVQWFDTWITPSAEKRRYHARFFWATVPDDVGVDARADGHETHDERWCTVAEHLAAWEAKEIDLPPPTLATLLRLRDRGVTAVLDADPHGAILPKWIPQQDRHVVVLPHDPAYAQLPGDGAPAPIRVSDLPHRFVRDDGRWRPL